MMDNLIIKILYILLLLNLGSFSELDKDEDFSFLMVDVNKQPHLKDPYDMFATSENKIDPYSIEDKGDKANCKYEAMKIKKCSHELNQYSSEINILKEKLKEKDEIIFSLQKKFTNNSSSKIDIIGFYTRILHKFWKFLDMEENESYLQGGSDALINHLIVTLTASDINAFKQYFDGMDTHVQIDRFFSERFEVQPRNDRQSMWEFLIKLSINFAKEFRSFETWIYTLWGLILLMSLWGFYLFVRDIQRNLRWKKLIFMVLILSFLLSCIFHWRHMLKVREIKRQTYLMQRGKDESLACNEGEGLLSRINMALLGGQSKCEKFQENLAIIPEEEVSPMMVISETTSKFVLLPLRNLGENFGLFFVNIPFLYQFPATVFVATLFTITIMAWFGYGIHFPLWLGGIYPSMHGNNNEDLKEYVKESQERMASENRAMIEEAKAMLKEISNVAISQVTNSPSKIILEPVVQNCSSIIGKRLEDIIERKLVSNMNAFQTKDKIDGTQTIERALQSPGDWRRISDRSVQSLPISTRSLSFEEQRTAPTNDNIRVSRANSDPVASEENSFILEVRKVLSESSSFIDEEKSSSPTKTIRQLNGTEVFK